MKEKENWHSDSTLEAVGGIISCIFFSNIVPGTEREKFSSDKDLEKSRVKL